MNGLRAASHGPQALVTLAGHRIWGWQSERKFLGGH